MVVRRSSIQYYTGYIYAVYMIPNACDMHTKVAKLRNVYLNEFVRKSMPHIM